MPTNSPQLGGLPVEEMPLELLKGISSSRSCSLRIVNPGVTTGSPYLHQFVSGNSLNATLRNRHGDTIHLHQLCPHRGLLQLLNSVLYLKARNGPLSLQIKQLLENSPQCESKGFSIRVQPIVPLPQRPKLVQVNCMDEHRRTMAEFSSRLSQRSANPRPVPREVLVWQVLMAHFVSFNHLLESGR